AICSDAAAEDDAGSYPGNGLRRCGGLNGRVVATDQEDLVAGRSGTHWNGGVEAWPCPAGHCAPASGVKAKFTGIRVVPPTGFPFCIPGLNFQCVAAAMAACLNSWLETECSASTCTPCTLPFASTETSRTTVPCSCLLIASPG